MSEHKNLRHVADNTLAAITSTQPSLQRTETGFPTGDVGILGLTVRWGGTFNTSSAAGAVVADGALKFLRNLRVFTDKHGDIVRNVSGLSLSRVLRLGGRSSKPVVVDCASTADATTFRAALFIPFADFDRLVRPFDAILDMKESLMRVHRQYGVVTDVQSAGTAATLNGVREDISVEVSEGLLTDEANSELPSYVPIWEETPFDASTTGLLKCPISAGDRILRRVYFSQQTIDATTGRQTEVSSVIGDTAKVSFKIGNEVIVDRVTWGELTDSNLPAAKEASLSVMPTGWGFLDFDRSKSVRKMLNLYKYPSGIDCRVEIESITGVSTAKVQMIQEYFQLLPPQAVRRV